MILEVPVDRIFPLRHDVLRHGFPLEASIYPGDDDPATFHLAALDGETVIGCATGLVVPRPGTTEPAYQLRGMAVAEGLRSQGIGARILAVFERTARERGLTLVWCNGRKTAGDFYRREGWVQTSDEFESVGLPHFIFEKRLEG